MPGRRRRTAPAALRREGPSWTGWKVAADRVPVAEVDDEVDTRARAVDQDDAGLRRVAGVAIEAGLLEQRAGRQRRERAYLLPHRQDPFVAAIRQRYGILERRAVARERDGRCWLELEEVAQGLRERVERDDEHGLGAIGHRAAERYRAADAEEARGAHRHGLQAIVAGERSQGDERGARDAPPHVCNDRSGCPSRQLDPPFHGEYVLVRHADLRVPLHQVRGALQPARGDRTARPHGARLPAVRVARGGAGALAVLRQNGSEKLTPVFERLRDALRAALDAATPPGDLRDLTRQMREAVVEAKVAVVETGEAVARTERELAQERQRLADAERRGRLASRIPGAGTLALARRFSAEHPERLRGLRQKPAAARGQAPPV